MKTNAIGTTVDLKDCIQNYLKTDLVDSDYMCINPDCLSNERKIEVNIDEYPLVLVLHLKRFEVDFESNKVSKNMQQIKIDEELVFTQDSESGHTTVSNDLTQKGIKYKLFGRVNHYGTHQIGYHTW